MAKSIKLADEIMDELREESELQSRSISGQATYYIRLGQAMERSIPYQKLKQALKGDLDTKELSSEELAVWNQAMFHSLTAPDEAEDAFFEDRRRRGLGVGMDEQGNIIGDRVDAAA
ncbi:TA system antitoxin ParD family protein [Croceicoccus mobilis]|uniref:Uncharacterized protein n=1 Tax=Croceicoccus mobilis TaxID=1703339 RepID=A0A916Z4Z5_9SPHN|nr:hypothetical protein [Croceicoccus mobilis]GGD74789.1 hypothetical protein GCM10010990_25560 [Croceicoccus mobilis]